jgi:peptidoglycan hydrolase-like protein with peptidoglycan-binding domain
MEALILLFLLMAARSSRGGGGLIREPEDYQPPIAQLPPPRGSQTSTPETQWPQVVPPTLPAFPAGWEYDEPPPTEVRARAKALLDSLWKTGVNSKLVEQTAGRWITYRAEITRGNKHGIVAYRLKKLSAVPAPKAPAPRAPAPAAPRGPSPAPGQTAQNQPAAYYPIDSRSPGIPQANAAAAPGSVRVPLPGGSVDVRVGPATPTRPVLHQGAGKGALLGLKPYVLEVQTKLLVDLSKGGAGEFGPLTFAAVKRFQADQVAQGRAGWIPKDVDGVVGPKTWGVLDLIGMRAAG